MIDFDHISYWETRYASGGNSGAGSYNKDAEAKAEYINKTHELISGDTTIRS